MSFIPRSTKIPVMDNLRLSLHKIGACKASNPAPGPFRTPAATHRMAAWITTRGIELIIGVKFRCQVRDTRVEVSRSRVAPLKIARVGKSTYRQLPLQRLKALESCSNFLCPYDSSRFAFTGVLTWECNTGFQMLHASLHRPVHVYTCGFVCMCIVYVGMYVHNVYLFISRSLSLSLPLSLSLSLFVSLWRAWHAKVGLGSFASEARSSEG